MATEAPQHSSYDVVIVGGAIMGSSTAWHLTEQPDFDGRVLVVERDPSYEFCSTAHSNSCVRQQFSTELNIKISQYTVDYVRSFRDRLGGDPRVPDLRVQNFGYLYLADTPKFADHLRRVQQVQASCGAATELLGPEDLAAAYPFYNLDGILLGSINRRDEGYFDGATFFDWWRRKARERGVEYIANEVVAMTRLHDRVVSVTLSSGETVACGTVVNAAGPRAARVSRMAGLDLPVEPRKRFTWIFAAETPLDQPLPLTIDPSGVHVRENGGGTYMAGGHLDKDEAAEPEDFAMDPGIWMDKIWPTLATRIPAFEAIKVQQEWTGHYAYNVFDHNAVLGPHPEVANFVFINGFSGHGLQQSPAMGRGAAEWITHGAYRSLDMTPFAYSRLVEDRPILERAVI